MDFLRNAWYAAAWGDEIVPGSLFRRTLLNTDVLFYRLRGGGVVAMDNRCPHRFAPLHRGKLIGDQVQCGYHGLEFAPTGVCAHNPHGDGRLPARATVRTYPVRERLGVTWIWMGDPALAEVAAVPDLSGLDPAGFSVNKGYIFVDANYELVSDNLLDSSHIAYLHPDLGSESVTQGNTTIERVGDAVRVDRFMPGERLPRFLDMVYGMNGQLVDRWLEVSWQPPAVIEVRISVAPAGSVRADALQRPTYHLVTPETDWTSHYFWSSSRDFRHDDVALHGMLQSGIARVFETEDKPMIEAQQETVGRFDMGTLNPIPLVGDGGVFQARSILRKSIAREAAARAGGGDNRSAVAVGRSG